MDPSRSGGRQLLSRPLALIAGAVVAALLGLTLLLLLTVNRSNDPVAQDLLVAGPEEVNETTVVTEAGPDNPPDAGENDDLPDDSIDDGADDDDNSLVGSDPFVAGAQDSIDDGDRATPPAVTAPPARPVPLTPTPPVPPTTTTTIPQPTAPPAAPDTTPDSTTPTSLPGSEFFLQDESPPPEPVAGAGRATVDTARAADGGSGLSDHLRIQVSVAEAPAAGKRLFLVCYPDDLSGSPRTTWYGKAEITGTGQQFVDATFTNPDPDPGAGSVVGLKWVCGVASAEPAAADMLTFLMQMDAQHQFVDTTTGLPFDVLRQTLPNGAAIISNTVPLIPGRLQP